MQEIPQTSDMNENVDPVVQQPTGVVQEAGGEMPTKGVLPEKKNKGLIITGLVLGFIFIAGAVFFRFQQNIELNKVLQEKANEVRNNGKYQQDDSDEMSDRNTYIDQNKIFSFKYSNDDDVYYYHNEENNFNWFTVASKETVKRLNSGLGDGAGAYGILSIKQSETPYEFKFPDYQEVTSSSTDLNGTEFTEYKIRMLDYGPDFTKDEVQTIFETKIDDLYFTIIQPNNNALLEFNKIVSTFEFVASESLSTNLSPIIYSISVPDGYDLLKETTDTKEYGFNDFSYLTISTGEITDLNSLGKVSDNCPSTGYDFCLSKGKNWGKDSNIENITLDGVPAKSFYISGGVDNVYHIIQTTQSPLIELKMYVAGGGLDQQFSKVLSSFKFVD